MSRNNIFDGDSYHAQFAVITYRWLMSRRWVTYADVLAKYLGLESANDLEYSVSKYYEYTKDDDEKKKGIRELKKAFPKVCNAIKEKVGKESIEEEGNNRNKSFRYIGKADDPLADMLNAKAINNLSQYWQFCQDSAGFFPTSWLEYFFKDCKDLLAIKKKRQEGKQILTSSLDRILSNIDLLPLLYEAINKHYVLSIQYKPYEEKEAMDLIFHPQHLREYNGRWHLFGKAEDRTPEWTFDIAIDRIIGKPRELYKVKYEAAPDNFYKEFFKDKVGVSHIPGNEAVDIIIRAHSINMYKLTETKPIHHSQKILSDFEEHEDGSYGDFSIHVELNNELIGRILQMGDGLEVVSPDCVRKIFADRIENMHRLYAKGTESTDKDS